MFVVEAQRRALNIIVQDIISTFISVLAWFLCALKKCQCRNALLEMKKTKKLLLIRYLKIKSKGMFNVPTALKRQFNYDIMLFIQKDNVKHAVLKLLVTQINKVKRTVF